MPGFMLFGGVIELLAVGWATSRPMTNLPLMVLDQDRSAASRAIVTALENTGTFAFEAQSAWRRCGPMARSWPPPAQ